MKDIFIRPYKWSDEYTGQEIIDWIANNPKDPISLELTRKYYQFDEEWFDIKCNINPNRKYTIYSYFAYWYTDRETHQTYRIERVPIIQPRRSSLKKGK